MEDKLLPKFLEILDSALKSSVRGKPADLDSYLVALPESLLPNTKTTVRCHFLHLDGNGRPKVVPLVRFLIDLLIDYAIPRTLAEEARSDWEKSKSTQKITALHTKAKNLFTHIKNTGEGGEFLLYVLVERYLGIPQIICKMPLKTNGNVHFHGVDGVHAKVETAEGKLAIYWGESKLYKNIHSGVSECFKSLSHFLNSTGGATDPAERDLDLICGS